MGSRFFLVGLGLYGVTLFGCAPGYMSVRELNNNNQGPKECASRCEELGMKMGALVLVSNSVPGCVCEPAPQPGGVKDPGAAAAVTGEVVIAAAAAAHQEQQRQEQQRQQQQQTYATKH